MLSPGDQVFIDGNNDAKDRWKVIAVVEGVDFSTGEKTNLHSLQRNSQVAFNIPAKRITGHWVEG